VAREGKTVDAGWNKGIKVSRKRDWPKKLCRDLRGLEVYGKSRKLPTRKG